MKVTEILYINIYLNLTKLKLEYSTGTFEGCEAVRTILGTASSFRVMFVRKLDD